MPSIISQCREGGVPLGEEPPLMPPDVRSLNGNLLTPVEATRGECLAEDLSGEVRG